MGANRNGAGLGAEQNALKTVGLREGLGAPQRVNTQQPGRCSGEGVEGTGLFFYFKICDLSVLNSLDSHLSRSSPPWQAWAARVKEKV